MSPRRTGEVFVLGTGSGLLAYPSPPSLYSSLGKAFSLHRLQGGRHTQASQGVGYTAGYDRPRGRSPTGSLEGGLGEAGATESLSAGILAGGNPPPQPLLVAVGHRTHMPTFSFLPLTDGHSNEEDLRGGAVGEHHSRGCEAVF